jgi:adenylosuccinate synthase
MALLRDVLGEPDGVTEVNLSLLDVLDVMEEIKICTAYDIDGERTTAVPSAVDEYEKAMPIYESIHGWKAELTGARSLGDLPDEAREYISTIEQVIGAPITMIGVGPGREQLIPLTDWAAIRQITPTR